MSVQTQTVKISITPVTNDAPEAAKNQNNIDDFKNRMLKVADTCSLKIGQGVYKNASEDTYITKLKCPMGKLPKLMGEVAEFASKHKQDSALVCVPKAKGEEKAEPRATFKKEESFSQEEKNKIKEKITENGFSAVTIGENEFFLQNINQWDGLSSDQFEQKIQEISKGIGDLKLKCSMKYCEVKILDQNNYGNYIEKK